MAEIGTYEIGLDTPIHMLTPRQLFAMQTEWLAAHTPKVEKEVSESKGWYVNSMADLAEILGTSQSTVYRMKAEGLLDDAISQYGKWVCIDVNTVLEKFKLSNRKRLMRHAAQTTKKLGSV